MNPLLNNNLFYAKNCQKYVNHIPPKVQQSGYGVPNSRSEIHIARNIIIEQIFYHITKELLIYYG